MALPDKIIERVEVMGPPLYIVALNRLARLGKGHKYAPTRRFVQFYPSRLKLDLKWVDLKDAESVILIYNDHQ